MAYLQELDDFPREVQRGAATVLPWWPKVAGEGNVAADASPAPTATVESPTGEALGSAAVAVTLVEGVSRFAVTVDASDAAIWQLGELYRLTVAWAFGGEARSESERFAVVAELYRPDVSLSDLLDEVPNAAQILSAQASRQATTITPEQRAAQLGLHAWTDVHEWLRS